MSTLAVGHQCSLDGCKLVDFLPVKCQLCLRSFCGQHAIADHHSCEGLRMDVLTFEPSTPRARCAMDGCTKPSLESLVLSEQSTHAVCSGCSGAFCAEHRHPDSHSCPSLAAQSEAAANSKPRIIPKPFIARPIKDQKILLMKLRHKAKPADPKDMNAQYKPGEGFMVQLRNPEGVYWFRKHITAGRALDLVSKDHTSKRVFVHNGKTLLHNLPLAEQVQEAAILEVQSSDDPVQGE